MSKHQTCPKCHSGFVGPDSNINENLCPECYDEVHKECKAEIESLQIENAKLKNLLERGIDILEAWKKLAKN